uniref:Uncharacterized protein n=1 Tax=Tetranychus urticae TaxID=32264 RepID=T1KMP7_TETUR
MNIDISSLYNQINKRDSFQSLSSKEQYSGNMERRAESWEILETISSLE